LENSNTYEETRSNFKGIFMNHLGYFIERMHEYGYAHDTRYKSLI